MKNKSNKVSANAKNKSLKQGTVRRGANNCPTCGGKMPKAEHYGGLPSNIYQYATCKKCGEELLSMFEWVEKDGQMGEFFWGKCKHSKFG